MLVPCRLLPTALLRLVSRILHMASGRRKLDNMVSPALSAPWMSQLLTCENGRDTPEERYVSAPSYIAPLGMNSVLCFVMNFTLLILI